jgi:hypothetical protein
VRLPKVPTLEHLSSLPPAEWIRELERTQHELDEAAAEIDAQDNRRTRPPDDETVTLESVTLAQIYVVRQADRLVAALRAINWDNFAGSVVDQITARGENDPHAAPAFTLLSAPDPTKALLGCGVIALPEGIERIYGRRCLLGPGLDALILTFVPAAAEASCLDKALREDVERDPVSRSSPVYDVKSDRVHRARRKLVESCAAWLETKFPGALTSTRGPAGIPACLQVSLVKGRPLRAQARYMELLGLAEGSGGLRFTRPDYLYLIPLSGREYIAALSEADARESEPSFSPALSAKVLQDRIWPFMLERALRGVLRSFETRMQVMLSDLGKVELGGTTEPSAPTARLRSWLGFTQATDSQVARLRNELLAVSRVIAIVTGDMAAVVDGAVEIWRDYPSFQSDPAPAATARAELQVLMAKIRAQETGLRELVLVTSQAVSDVQNTLTQKRLNGLTVALVLLTLALVFIGVIQIV